MLREERRLEVQAQEMLAKKQAAKRALAEQQEAERALAEQQAAESASRKRKRADSADSEATSDGIPAAKYQRPDSPNGGSQSPQGNTDPTEEGNDPPNADASSSTSDDDAGPSSSSSEKAQPSPAREVSHSPIREAQLPRTMSTPDLLFSPHRNRERLEKIPRGVVPGLGSSCS